MLLKLEGLYTNKKTTPVSFPIKSTDVMAAKEGVGFGLVALGKKYSDVVVLDAELSNSTHTDKFQKAFPDRFFEMFIAEQNMGSAAAGMSTRGVVPFVSTFATFLTRAFDQIRMAQYSNTNLKILGSYAGVSLGKDGPSQMGLEDVAMMRSILESKVLCAADAVSAYTMIETMYKEKGIVYLRTARLKTPILYDKNEAFPLGGLKILRQSEKDSAVVFATGVTVHEAFKAYEELKKKNIFITVVDIYSIKPLDEKTIIELSIKIPHIIVVEDHYPAGGLGEAIKSLLSGKNIDIKHLAINKIPRSGKPEELLVFEEIDKTAIVSFIKNMS